MTATGHIQWYTVFHHNTCRPGSDNLDSFSFRPPPTWTAATNIHSCPPCPIWTLCPPMGCGTALRTVRSPLTSTLLSLHRIWWRVHYMRLGWGLGRDLGSTVTEGLVSTLLESVSTSRTSTHHPERSILNPPLLCRWVQTRNQYSRNVWMMAWSSKLSSFYYSRIKILFFTPRFIVDFLALIFLWGFS